MVVVDDPINQQRPVEITSIDELSSCKRAEKNKAGIWAKNAITARHLLQRESELLLGKASILGCSLKTWPLGTTLFSELCDCWKSCCFTHQNHSPFGSNFSTFTKNAHWSAVSSMILAVGFPAPWPARVSMRIRIGLSLA